jgi:hypothetical protein
MMVPKNSIALAIALLMSSSSFGEMMNFELHDQNKPFSPRFENTENLDVSSTQTTGANRVHRDGIVELRAVTIAPLRLNVAAIGAVIGNVEVTTRHETTTVYELNAGDISDTQNIWDETGQASLVPAQLTCKVAHRGTMSDYKKGGLGMSVPTPGGGIGFDIDYETLQAEFWEAEKSCPVGPIPKHTTHTQIALLCESCLKRVRKTLEQDVTSRMKNLTYIVKNTLCSTDKECRSENNTWAVGRCLLTKDKNASYFTKCHARSKIGGICPGVGDNGMFRYPCDKGLKCVQVHKSQGYSLWNGSYDYNKFECRDPKHPQWTKTPPGYYDDI